MRSQPGKPFHCKALCPWEGLQLSDSIWEEGARSTATCSTKWICWVEWKGWLHPDEQMRDSCLEVALKIDLRCHSASVGFSRQKWGWKQKVCQVEGTASAKVWRAENLTCKVGLTTLSLWSMGPTLLFPPAWVEPLAAVALKCVDLLLP